MSKAPFGYAVVNLGCKVNRVEADGFERLLGERGGAPAPEGAADLIIVNTCTVTGEADKKTRKAVRHALSANDGARIVVTGCATEIDAATYKAMGERVRVVPKAGMALFLNEMELPGSDSSSSDLTAHGGRSSVLPSDGRTRVGVKVQDGCDNFCSYCIIPYLRGRSRSRSLRSIVNEANEMAKRTREIVVTGINVSDYGSDIGLTLFDLVHALSAVPARKRFGSLECTVVDEKLLNEMKNGDWCDSVHLSMQSGSDTVLRRMNRKYTSEFFIEKCDLIKRYFPDAGITTDVIVGFPGETDEEFEETVRVCRRAGFAWLHVFPYSSRKEIGRAHV